MSGQAPWYADGLCFECTGCGACCRGHGMVEVSDADIARLAAGMSLAEPTFRELYTRPLRKGRIALTDQPGGDCVFFDRASAHCTLQVHRPEQCRAYPFWPSALFSPESWRAEAEACEGIGRGALHSQVDIRSLLREE
jgi:hypothetical protein